MSGTPDWLNATHIEKITARIQQKLEWSIRRVNVSWHSTADSFQKAHSLGPQALAVTTREKNVTTIHLGPKVTKENFDEVFAHELVHVIVYQKYKSAIPTWLEEGLANHFANQKKVDYQWLAKQPFPNDVRELAHPFSGTAEGVVYRYKASQAFAEMLDKKCNLENLLRLSVQRKMEDYMNTYCRIKDLNEAFRAWVTGPHR